MKKIMLMLAMLATIVGLAFADNKICELFDNGSKGGIYVTVTSQKIEKKDPTLTEYDNTITVMSNGNKMRVIECKIDKGYGRRVSYGETGYILTEYGSHQEVFRTAERPLTTNQIHVKAEGCN